MHRCIRVADQSLHTITGTPMGSFSCVSEQRLGLLRSELDYCNVTEIISGGLHEFCDTLQAKMNTIDECILGDFFVQRASSLSAGAAATRR